MKAHFPKLTKGLRIRSISFEEVDRAKARAKREAAKRGRERKAAEKKAREDAARHEVEWLAGERGSLRHVYGRSSLWICATRGNL